MSRLSEAVNELIATRDNAMEWNQKCEDEFYCDSGDAIQLIEQFIAAINKVENNWSNDEPEVERCDTCGAGPAEVHPSSCADRIELDNGLDDIDDYEQRVRALEAEGLTRSDAQAVADVELEKPGECGDCREIYSRDQKGQTCRKCGRGVIS